METIYKTFRAELKEPDEDGSLNMFIPVSTASMDRDSEVIEPSAFKKTIPKFMRHPVLVASHDYRDLTNQIGEWTKLKITDSGIEGKPKYYIGMDNPQADWAYKLAQKGVAAFSIGFIPKEWEDGDGIKSARRTYKEVELLEISQVIIPSNREAIQNIRSKSVDPVINQLIDDIVNAPIVDLTGESEVITKPEETEDYIRIPVDSGNHEGHRIRIAKDHDWTMAKARTWVKEHEKKTLEVEHGISQSEIIDEIDYLKSLIEKEGLSEEAKSSATELVKVMCSDEIIRELTKRLPANDIAVKDKELLTNQDILESLKRISNIGGK